MQTILVTPPDPDEAVVTLAEAKLHLRVEHDEDDTDITRLIAAAVELCEKESREVFLSATFRTEFDGLPGGGGYWDHRHRAAWPSVASIPRGLALVLPRGPLVSVESVEYLDATGQLRELDPSLYHYRPGRGGKLEPAIGASWPGDVARLVGSVRVTYRAGHGDTRSAVPQRYRHAVLLAVGGWYENREEIVIGGTPTVLPLGINRLLAGVPRYA